MSRNAEINVLKHLVSLGDIQSQNQRAEKYFYLWKSKSDRQVERFDQDGNALGEKSIEKQENFYRSQFKGVLLEAVRLYEELAQVGDNRALLGLGNIYSRKSCSSAGFYDQEKAINYYEKALSEGSLEAADKLIMIYRCSRCDSQDYDEVSRVLSQVSNTWGGKKIKL